MMNDEAKGTKSLGEKGAGLSDYGFATEPPSDAASLVTRFLWVFWSTQSNVWLVVVR